MHLHFGVPHFVETESERTFGGEEEAWGFLLPSNQRVLVLYRVPYGHAVLNADPPELESVLSALGLSRELPGFKDLGVGYPLS